MQTLHSQLFLLCAGKNTTVTQFSCKNDAINTNYRFQVSVFSSTPLKPSIGEHMCFNISNQRFLWGYLTKYIFRGKRAQRYFYQFYFHSPLEKLNVLRNKNFTNKTPTAILTELLKKNNFLNVEMHFSKRKAPIPYLAQYQENDLRFFERLLKLNACFYFWEQQKDAATLHISDTAPGIAKKFPPKLLPYKPFNTGIDNEPVIFEKSCLLSNKKTHYHFKTNCCDLMPGQLLHVCDNQDNQYNKTFRIINIEHYGEQHADLNTQEKMVYTNKITCVNFNDSITLTDTPKAFTQILTAKITEKKGAVLTENGDYRVALDYDTKTNTPPIKRLQDFNGNQYGMHFPLTKNSWVLTGFLYDDLNKPLILGQIPTTHEPTTVTAKNPQQSILRTAQASQIIFDNQTESLLLANQNNRLLLDKKGMLLKSHDGNIVINAQNDYLADIGKNSFIQAGMNYQQIQSKKYQLVTNNIIFTAKNKLHFNANQHVQLQSANITLNAKEAIQIASTHENCKINGNMEITAINALNHSAEQLNLHASKNITFNENGLLTPEQLTLKGNCLTLKAETLNIAQDSWIND